MTLSPDGVCYILCTKLGKAEAGLSELGMEDRYKLIGEADIVGHRCRYQTAFLQQITFVVFGQPLLLG
jgi:hypothetical protein